MSTILLQQDLKPFNTFHIHARAAGFGRFSNEDELNALLDEAKTKSFSQAPMVLGGGSNILFTKDFNGLVLKNEWKGIELVKEDNHHYFVQVGGGENWHALVMHCIQHGWAGIENLSLIPGNVGASPIQNIGAYGVELKDVFHSLEAFHLQERSMQTFTHSDCAFGYRDSVFKSIFKGQFAICKVVLRLRKEPIFHTGYGAINAELEKMGVHELSIRNISEAVIRIRKSKLPDPEVIGNAGSFFKNPVIATAHFQDLQKSHPDITGYPANDTETKVPAGWLIEQCGWKGYKKGDAGVHAHQALVLVNYNNASGAELLALSEDILRSVKERFGIDLEREVNIL